MLGLKGFRGVCPQQLDPLGQRLLENFSRPVVVAVLQVSPAQFGEGREAFAVIGAQAAALGLRHSPPEFDRLFLLRPRGDSQSAQDHDLVGQISERFRVLRTQKLRLQRNRTVNLLFGLSIMVQIGVCFRQCPAEGRLGQGPAAESNG